jgi:hypothetical protein
LKAEPKEKFGGDKMLIKRAQKLAVGIFIAVPFKGTYLLSSNFTTALIQQVEAADAQEHQQESEWIKGQLSWFNTSFIQS